METITGIELIDRRLDDMAIQSIVRDSLKDQKAVDLGKVKGDDNSCAVLAVIAFKPNKVTIDAKEFISIYLCDLKNAQTTARLLVDRSVFGVIMAAVKPPASVEGLLLLIVKPTVSIDINNGGSLTFNVERQNQLAVVGRCKYFARCGAAKKAVGPDGMEMLCKLPIDSSLCVHCSYHARQLSQEQTPSVGSKRSVTASETQSNKLLNVASHESISKYMLKSSTSTINSSAILNNDRDKSMNEQDDSDVAFSLRKHSGAVRDLLGAAYSNAQGDSVLNKADPIELRAAQRIIQNLVIQQTNSNIAQRNPYAVGTYGVPPTTSATTAHAAVTLPLQQGGGRIPQRAVSALSQKADRITTARSGNQTNSYVNQTDHSVHASNSVAPSQTSMMANSSTRNAYLVSQQGSNHTSLNNNSTVSRSAPSSGAYKLVGDTLINSNNLAKNAAKISIPGAPSQVANAALSTKPVSVFHQLLAGPAPVAVKPTVLVPSTITPGSAICWPTSQNTAHSAQRSTTTNIQSASTPSRPNTQPATTAAFTSTVPPPPSQKKANAPQAVAKAAKSALELEIDALLGKTSSHASEADADWAEGFDKRMDVLAKREYAQTKAAEVQSIEISAYKCLQCEGRITELFPALCQGNKHTVTKIVVVKRFFECGQCGKREHSLSARKDLGSKVVLPPEVRCLTCGSFRWRPCGQRGSGPLSVSVKDTLGGDAKLNGVAGGKLILSASEWSKRGDNVSMAERVSTLK